MIKNTNVIHQAELYQGIEMDKQMSIQEVSDRLGLPKSTLRYWEKAFKGYIAPTRTTGGQRRYAEADMKIITAICKYKNMGLSLNQIKDRLPSNTQSVEAFDLMEVEQLAKRIANTVKKEICNFFEQGHPETEGNHVNERQANE